MGYGVVATPEDIDTFANTLERFTNEMVADAYKVQGQFQNLGSTWRDAQFAAFAEEFVTTMHVLARFSQVVEEQVPYLRQHAELLRAVREHRR